MMPLRTRVLAVAAATALVLAACGDGDADPGVDDDPVDLDTDGVEDGAAEDDAEEDGDTGDDAAAAPLAVTGTNDLVWDVEELSAPAGTVEFELTCEAALHDLVIEELDETVAECGPQETVTGSVELDEGEYTYVCTVPGHSNMRGSLTVG